jgi:FkbM family methyltransferase
MSIARRAAAILRRLPIGGSFVEVLRGSSRSDYDALHSENEALRAQLSNVGLELQDARSRLDALLQHNNRRIQSENEALRAQLSNVGLELQDARVRLDALLERDKRKDSPIAARYRDRQVLILLPRLLDLLPPEERFLIVDGGAREVDRDPRWRPFPPHRLRFVGFEPDEAEAARLNATPGPGGLEWQFIPAGLWGTSGRLRFEHNKATGGSSFLTQNRDLTDRWKFENATETSLARDVFFPVSHEDSRVLSLADWAKDADVHVIDFLKLNVQGGELAILRGAGDLLDRCFQIFIAFSPAEISPFSICWLITMLDDPPLPSPRSIWWSPSRNWASSSRSGDN